MTNTEEFKPTEVWTPDDDGFELGEAIEQARLEINSKDSTQLIHDLKQQVKRSSNGIVYAALKGEHPEEYSDTDALVMFNPFANTATANMLVRAEFVREVAKKADIRDEQGKLKPVIMLASPGIYGSHLHLTKEEKSLIRQGDLGPAAKEYLKAVAAMEIGRVALLGFSQGADMALSGAMNARPSNLDPDRLAIGDPVGIVERSRYQLLKDFLSSGSGMQSAVFAGDIKAQQQAIGNNPLSVARNRDFVRFGGISLTRTNRMLWETLSTDSFENNMQQILDSRDLEKIVVGYATKDKVASTKNLEPSLANLHRRVEDNRLVSVRITGKDHTWENQLPLLAKLYLRALV